MTSKGNTNLDWHRDILLLFVDLLPKENQDDFMTALNRFNSAHDQERRNAVSAAFDHARVQRLINRVKDHK